MFTCRAMPHYLILTLIAFILFACQNAIPLSGNLPVQAPHYLAVGTPLTVTVGPVTVTDGTHVGLVLVGKHGPRIYRSTFEQGVAEFRIPAEHTLQAGTFALIAASQNARGEAAMIFEVIPDQGA